MYFILSLLFFMLEKLDRELEFIAAFLGAYLPSRKPMLSLLAFQLEPAL